MNPYFRDQMHSYALARIMMHTIGYANFEPRDHAIHTLLIQDTRQNHWEGNFMDKLKEYTESHEKFVKSISKDEE